MLKLFRYIIGLLSILVYFPQLLAEEQKRDSLHHLLIIEDGYQKADLYLHLSQAFKRTNIDSAIRYAEESKEISLEEGNAWGVASALFDLGKINLRRDSTLLARDYFDLAMVFVEECDDCDSLNASINLFRGKSYTFQDNYPEAITYFLRSIEIAEEIDNKEILSDLYDDIGMVMLFLEDNQQALNYFNQALEINRMIDNNFLSIFSSIINK